MNYEGYGRKRSSPSIGGIGDFLGGTEGNHATPHSV
jgi:hypothetical protein